MLLRNYSYLLLMLFIAFCFLSNIENFNNRLALSTAEKLSVFCFFQVTNCVKTKTNIDLKYCMKRDKFKLEELITSLHYFQKSPQNGATCQC